VVAVKRLHNGCAHLPCTDEDDLHGARSLVPAQADVGRSRPSYRESHSGSSSMPTPSAIRFT
jgi:hypothetical protein